MTVKKKEREKGESGNQDLAPESATFQILET